MARRGVRLILEGLVGLLKLALLAYTCLRAYRIRMHAIKTYGFLIHEFDPWFNYRATEYLAQHGWRQFFRWYDYMSWYPIGRPIGTTIYPGMQFVAVWIWEAMKYVPKAKWKLPKAYRSQLPTWLLEYLPNKGKFLSFGPMSLNDVCCMTPVWFGASATFFTYLLAAELSGSSGAGLFAAAIMSIIPAHIMRSVGGGFDNECVAVTTFCCTLWLWCRALRTPRSWPFAILGGVAYAAAAATWGGYIFVNNMVALHAAFLVAIGKYSRNLYLSYTLFWLIGTVGATYVPVIGWAPLRSLEQMPSLLTFAVYQVMELCDVYRRRRAAPMSGWVFFFLRAGVFAVLAAAMGAVGFVLMQRGVFMPLGARIRGLFLEAVKTGNPLVDSVAEHQPADEQAYDMFLGPPRFMAMFGLLFAFHQGTPAKFLTFLYAAVAYHYSLKMSRLMIICGPIVSVLAGFPLGIAGDWCVEQIFCLFYTPAPAPAPTLPERSGGMGSIIRALGRWFGNVWWPQEVRGLLKAKNDFAAKYPLIDRPVRLVIATLVALWATSFCVPHAKEFQTRSEMIAKSMAEPQIAFEHQGMIITDYVDGYKWIAKNTPEDARVMAWWDYGYQITGVANRTSIADGNTWNHEHIATLGRILTSTEKRCHNAMRHLADYALVWAGGHGDDMGKSPHLARIGNSVFPDHCGDDDPLCRKYSFHSDGSPTPMMAKSFLYKAVNHGQHGVKLSSKFWKEVHTSQHGLFRVFKVLNVSEESKAWIADPNNRQCDAPGSWYCVGQYPPALAPLIAKRKNFAQLEDFNKQGTEKSAYTLLIEEERRKQASAEL